MSEKCKTQDECIREVCEEMKKAAATAGKQAQNEAEE